MPWQTKTIGKFNEVDTAARGHPWRFVSVQVIKELVECQSRNSGKMNNPGRGFLEELLVAEHGTHHVAPGHQDRLVRGTGPVLQLEQDVTEEAVLQA